MLGKIESKRRKGRQRMRWLDSTTDSTNMNLSKLWEIVLPEQTLGGQTGLVCCRSMGSQRVGHDLVTEQQEVELNLHW